MGGPHVNIMTITIDLFTTVLVALIPLGFTIGRFFRTATIDAVRDDLRRASIELEELQEAYHELATTYKNKLDSYDGQAEVKRECEREVIRLRSAYQLQQKEIIYWKGFVYSEYPEDHVENFENEVKAIREAHYRLADSSQVDGNSTQRPLD